MCFSKNKKCSTFAKIGNADKRRCGEIGNSYQAVGVKNDERVTRAAGCDSE
jgi:hypothetical protein